MQGKTIKLAAVQAASVLLDLEATTEKAAGLIREAGAAGADLIGFPEGYIPAHPSWYHFHPASSQKAIGFARRLAENAVEVPGPATEALCAAAAEGEIAVVMGICERDRDRPGTLYNSLLFIDERGELLGRHRKLVATLGERLVHTPGDLQGMRVYPMAGGKVGGLICGENSNPLAAFLLDSEGLNLHVASWPAHFNPGGVDMIEVTLFVSRALAYQAKAFVINAVGEIDADTLEQLPTDEDERQFLVESGGGASIIGPWGEIMAGPAPPGETIVYADADLGALVAPKVTQDFAGHYNRFDLMRLHVASRGGYPGVEEAEAVRPGAKEVEPGQEG